MNARTARLLRQYAAYEPLARADLLKRFWNVTPRNLRHKLRWNLIEKINTIKEG